MEGNASRLVDEFVAAVQKRYPDALIQFEDFLTPNAYALLNRYRDRVLCFNDDIQGTAAVALAGVYASTRITGAVPRSAHHVPRRRIRRHGHRRPDGVGASSTRASSLDEARRRLWFVDVNGLVVKGRTDLMAHNLPYAHDHAPLGFVEAIDAIRPHVLIGATGAPGTFTQQVVERMCAHQRAARALRALESNVEGGVHGRAGLRLEPRPGRLRQRQPVRRRDLRRPEFRPAQGNNAYVFPGIGLGAVACRARTLPDEFFLAAARTLAAWCGRRISTPARSIRRSRDIRRSRWRSP